MSNNTRGVKSYLAPKMLQSVFGRSGFLIIPTDELGNIIYNPETLDPQYNLLQTNKNDGYFVIKEDVTLRTLSIYWTDGKTLISQKYKNGKLLNVPTNDYAFQKSGHIIVFDFSSSLNRLRVYSFDGTLKQTFFVPDLRNQKNVMVNKSATEFFIHARIDSKPYPFDTVAYPTYFRMEDKWEAIARYSITETGDPETPFDFVLLDKKEQWNGYVIHQKTQQPGLPVDATTVMKEVYAKDVVLDAYYNDDVYTERVFSKQSFAYTDNLNDKSLNIAVTVGGKPCFFNMSWTNPITYNSSANMIVLSSFQKYSLIQPFYLAENTMTNGSPDYFTKSVADLNGNDAVLNYPTLDNSVNGGLIASFDFAITFIINVNRSQEISGTNQVFGASWNGVVDGTDTDITAYLDVRDVFLAADSQPFADISTDKHNNHSIHIKYDLEFLPISTSGNYGSLKVVNNLLANPQEPLDYYNLVPWGVI